MFLHMLLPCLVGVGENSFFVLYISGGIFGMYSGRVNETLVSNTNQNVKFWSSFNDIAETHVSSFELLVAG